MSNGIDKQVKEVKLYTFAKKWKHEDVFKVVVQTYQVKTDDIYDVIPLNETTIEVSISAVSEQQVLKAQVDTLQDALQKEKADSYVRVTAIEEKIQSLMCIEAPTS